VTFFGDGIGLVRNGTIVLQFNYTWTHDQEDDIEFSSTGLKFANNGTVILNK
jgi:hypothetical protein